TYGARLEAGDIAQARAWLDAGLDPDYAAEHIGTGLMIGAWRGDIPMMELFFARGADVNRANAIGERALMHASWRGNREAALWLIAHGASVNSEPMRWSALHYAVFAGHADLAGVLLEMGADINARSTNGSSVLMMAVYEGHESLVKELLARGADRSIRNDRGEGALEWAFKFQHLGIARLVASQQDFAAAANQPKAQWGEPVRSVPKPATLAAAPSGRLQELMRIRDVLASRGMTDAVAKMDRRIADLRAKEAASAAAPGTSVSLRQGRPPNQLEDLENMRDILASRGMKLAVTRLDRRIAAVRAQRARSDMDVPATAVLEISARRGAPAEQEMRLLLDANPP
ncbi:MAG: ankyrin repeat domain-containing protein, partial [Burkholderiales bacterium]